MSYNINMSDKATIFTIYTIVYKIKQTSNRLRGPDLEYYILYGINYPVVFTNNEDSSCYDNDNIYET